MKKIKYTNLNSNKELQFELADWLTIIYGKNGTGKTTISRSKDFDKKFVFNQDFISKNVYSIKEDGAIQSKDNKENFSSLWLSEEIVSLRKNIDNINILLSQIVKEKEKLNNRIYNDFENNFVHDENLNKHFKKYINKNIKVNVDELKLENINNEYNAYHHITNINTNIQSDEELKENSIKVKNDILLNKFFNDIEKSKILNELIFSNNNKYVENINKKIENITNEKQNLENLESFSKNKKISESLLQEIKLWLNKNKNETKCFFCENDISNIKQKWINYFNNDILKRKNEIIELINKEYNSIKIIINQKKEYKIIDKKLFIEIEKIYKSLEEKISKILDNNFTILNFKSLNINKQTLDKKIIMDNIKNYIIKKHIKEIEFYNSYFTFVEKYKKNKEKNLDKKMTNYGEKIKNNINYYISKFNLEKTITIKIDNRSNLKKFSYEINGKVNLKELSESEKHKIALAIFFYSILDKTTDESTDIVVIDDPVVTLDLESYLCFRNFLSKEVIAKRKKMKFLLLTHDFNYLYAQISNLIEKNYENIKIYKISNEKIKEYPKSYFNLDDISLFKVCLLNLKSRGELFELAKFSIRIFRIIQKFIELFDGKHFSNNVEYKSLRSFFCNIRSKIKETNSLSDELIFSTFENIKKASKIFLNIDFINDKKLHEIKEIIAKGDANIYSDYFDIIKTVTDFIYQKDQNLIRTFVDHPNFSYFKTSFSLSLDFDSVKKDNKT